MVDMRSKNRTFWQVDEKVVKQPRNIDYSQLLGKITKQTEKEASIQNNIKDLRKSASGPASELSTQRSTHFMYEDPNSAFRKDVGDELADIDKNSIIPIPGMMISYENDEHDWQPPTQDWIAPHGPQWGPMTQN